jgi:putative cardiolipin synthase
MHNKSWIADNRVALAGGRNLGDEYFHASRELNFVDLDFAMVGPVVRDVSASFDRYWNARSVVPVELLESTTVRFTPRERQPRSISCRRGRYIASARCGLRQPSALYAS